MVICGDLLGEGLDDDESSGERGHEVGVAGEDVERGGRGGLGAGGWGSRRCGGERLAGSEAHAGVPFRAVSRTMDVR